MNLPIIIMGPMCSGKSTVAKLLAERLSIPLYPLDYLRWYYYLKNGMNFLEDEKKKKGDFETLLKFRKIHDLYTLEQSVCKFRDGILEFGASQSYWVESSDIERVKKSLDGVKNSFLLLPTGNPEQDIDILNKRLVERDNGRSDDIEVLKTVNSKMITNEANKFIARHIIYTNDKSPTEVMEMIISKIT